MEPEVNGETNPLEEIPAEHIPTMLSQMRNHFPEAIHAHEYIRMLLKIKKTHPELKVSFLAPGGDYKLGILFFLLDEVELIGSIYCENEHAIKAMGEALMSDGLNIPTRETILFTGMNSNTYKAAKPFIDKKGWSELRGKVYWMPWYTARQLSVQLPEGVEIRNLVPEHAEIIDSVYRHRFPGSKEFIAKHIKLNFGLGVFRGDELLSWAVLFVFGWIGSVQTLESETRKGYGRAVMQAMCKKLGEMQSDVHLNVMIDNPTGEAFFKSIGFRFAYYSQTAGNKLH